MANQQFTPLGSAIHQNWRTGISLLLAEVKRDTGTNNTQAAAQQQFSSDPKYKKHTQQVEKCLNGLDNVHEWADCIAVLKQLLKTFQSYLQFKEIPHKLIVAKRLSQCLTPALPTGVHQRALDVYVHILSVLGIEGLKRDLPPWSSGLFPFFEYASTSVKPALLNIYDTYYLPLQHDLRPLSRRLPRLRRRRHHCNCRAQRRLDDQSVAAALEDDNLLVRRSTLDMLLQTMRVDSAAIKRAKPEDAAILMKAAIGVVLRRDLSLNQRLYTWLLGPDEKNEAQSAYLRQHALRLLSSTLKDEMFTPSGEYSESRPFKIFISLLDKWEIGSPLTGSLIYDTLKAIRQHMTAELETKEVITMTASTLLEATEPSILWKQLLKSILNAIDSSEHPLDAISLTLFLLRSLPMQDEEVKCIHLPVIFAVLMEKLLVHVQEDSSRVVSPVVRECFILQDELLQHFPPEALRQRPKLADPSQEPTSFLAFGLVFYGLDVPTLVSRNHSVTPLVSVVENSFAFSQIYAQVAVRQRDVSLSLRTSIYYRVLSLLGKLIESVEKGPDASLEISWSPPTWAELHFQNIDFNLVDSCISIFVALQRSSKFVPKLVADHKQVVSRMVKKLFRFLHQDWAVFHVRANLVLFTTLLRRSVFFGDQRSTSIDILQAIVARGEVDHLALESLEPIIIGKLYFFVHLKRLDLRNKFLRILHSLITVSIAHITQSNAEEQSSSEDGIAVPHNRPVQQHWLDFVLMAIPQFQPALQVMIPPLGDCVGRQLRSLLNDAVRANQPGSPSAITGVVTDVEFVMLLNTLERLLILGLANYSEVAHQDDDTSAQEKTAESTSGILGYVSNVFTADTASPSEAQSAVRSPGFRSLNDGVRVLFAIWVNFIWTSPASKRSEDDSLSMIYNRTRGRCRRVLEFLFRAYPSEVLEGVISCWDRDLTLQSRDPKPVESAAFELVDVLIASAHSAVHMICESIDGWSSGGSERSRRYINPVSDVTLFKVPRAISITIRGTLGPPVADLRMNEKADSSTVSLQDNSKPTWETSCRPRSSTSLQTTVVPNLWKLGKVMPIRFGQHSIDIIVELTKLPPALKSVFPIQFCGGFQVETNYQMFDSDKTSFALLGRIPTVPSTNIFVNRENEMLVQSLNLQRLSLVLFVREKNHFLIQLPSYWIFEQTIVSVLADESEDLPPILSASKCLDLLLTLQTSEFQMYALFTFCSDNLNLLMAILGINESMFDQLAKIIGSLPALDTWERS
ncbi:Dopey, N-terminal-domain-containing protein [Boletus edulis BED1]|uniref:Dopey, N-terminal-domain-containing protein n=1 Tax=Boletus edulis BED1 TaxID=1328754 RepID=A0AAD4BLF8_BOLED|nr:Dopey, N-terminal-domain-containing protein [Boletus edulis BED1]